MYHQCLYICILSLQISYGIYLYIYNVYDTPKTATNKTEYNTCGYIMIFWSFGDEMLHIFLHFNVQTLN